MMQQNNFITQPLEQQNSSSLNQNVNNDINKNIINQKSEMNGFKELNEEKIKTQKSNRAKNAIVCICLVLLTLTIIGLVVFGILHKMHENDKQSQSTDIKNNNNTQEQPTAVSKEITPDAKLASPLVAKEDLPVDGELPNPLYDSKWQEIFQEHPKTSLEDVQALTNLKL